MHEYDAKPDSYFASDRKDLYRVISRLGRFDRGVDIGCGEGRLLCALKKNGYVRKITGVEVNSCPMNNGCYDDFFKITAEEALSGEHFHEKFDLIIMADVLEHMPDPWFAMRQLVNNWLADGGVVVLSVPNFCNIFTFISILFRRSFRYQTEGVLDKTHLRFFCVKDILEMVKSRELCLDLEMIIPNFKNKSLKPFGSNRMRILNYLTLNLFPFWIGDQVTAVVRKQLPTIHS